MAASSRIGRFAVIFAAGWPLSTAFAAPLDKALQSLSDAAFVSGHAPPAGELNLNPTGDPSGLLLGAPVLYPQTPAMALAMTRVTPASNSVHLGGQVPVRTVGAVLQGKLRALGVKDGATEYGRDGRFYLFAAVHGQAVGLNLQTQGGSLHRSGWSTDQTSALVGDGQVGVGWRKGEVEAAVGYVHRGIHIKNAPIGVTDSLSEDMAAVSFTFRPRW